MTSLLLLLLLLQPAPFPPPPPGPPPAGPGAGSGAMRKQVGERIRMMRMWRLVEALGLDEATAQRLFPILHKYDEQLMPIHRMQADLTRRLGEEIQSARPDAQRIGAAIDEILKLRRQAQAIEEERTREVRKILSPVQQAKLILALPRIERELWLKVRRAMGQPEEDAP